MNLRATIWISGLTLSCLILAGAVKSGTSGAKEKERAAKPASPVKMALDSLDGLDILAMGTQGPESAKIKSDVGTYRGRRAVHLLNIDIHNPQSTPSGGESLAIVKGSDFKDGTIEVELVGMPREGAPEATRGFIGVAFRVQGRGAKYEAFYLRFTNGRAEDQFRRNHTAQYISEPEFPWYRLRQESPGTYESYVDVEEKAWTKVKIVVSGTKARLYVSAAQQPCLIVNDLKLGESRGQVALWNGSDTEAYFSNLRIE